MKEFLRKLNKGNGVSFLIYPIVFFVLSCLILWVTLGPILSPVTDAVSLFIGNSTPKFDNDGIDIYKGLAGTGQDITLKAGEYTYPTPGSGFGEIVVNSAKIKTAVYMGTGNNNRDVSLLKKGVLCSPSGAIPGGYTVNDGRTVLVAGHNNRDFHTLGAVKEGDKISFKTNYGQYIYQVTGHKVAADTDTSAYNLNNPEQNLIIYTCYPFSAMGLTTKRYFVYAAYVSGPELEMVH